MNSPISKPYFDYIDTDTNFVNTCVDVEEKAENIHIYGDTKTKCDGLSLNYLPIKTENIDIKMEGDCYEESWVKPEYVGIKSEVEEKSEEETKKGCTELNQLEVLEDRLEITTRPFVHNNQTKAQIRDILGTENLTSESYKCRNCVYETIWRSNFARHMLRHTDPSLVKLYACDKCDFKSKYQESFNDHQLRHTNPSHIRMYKCEDCEYETKHRSNLPMHRLMHKHPSEMHMYKCDSCPYEAKRKRNLISHQLRHRNPGEVQMYGCDKCEYKTKYRWSLPSHQVVHQSDLEVQMYKCDECDYETRHKNYLPKHKRTHIVKTYKYTKRQRQKQEQAPSVAAQ